MRRRGIYTGRELNVQLVRYHRLTSLICFKAEPITSPMSQPSPTFFDVIITDKGKAELQKVVDLLISALVPQYRDIDRSLRLIIWLLPESDPDLASLRTLLALDLTSHALVALREFWPQVRRYQSKLPTCGILKPFFPFTGIRGHNPLGFVLEGS